jgi:glycerophosphoryl diester phosphodiesterase
LLPEHTLAAYQLAIQQGADFIECDVLLTRDLAPICRHDPDLNVTTNAADLFPDRINTYVIDGKEHTGIFAADLTLAEVQQLRTKQRWGDLRGRQHDLLYPVPTLQEFLQLAAAAPRVVGVYPEAKHPTWHASLPWVAAANTSVHHILLEALVAAGYEGAYGSPTWLSAPVFIQSFEETSLQQLRQVTDLPLVLLLGGWENFTAPDTGLTHEEMVTDAHLQKVASYAQGVGPWKNTLYTSTTAAAAAAGAKGDSKISSEHPDRLTTQGSTAPHRAQHGGSSSSGGSWLLQMLSRDWWLPQKTGLHRARLGLEALPEESQGLHHQQHHQRPIYHQQPTQQQQGGSSSVPGLRSSGLTARLLAAGLQVHPYTLRDEAQFVPAGLPGGVAAEMQQLFVHEGVQGAFSDFPGTLHAWLSHKY